MQHDEIHTAMENNLDTFNDNISVHSVGIVNDNRSVHSVEIADQPPEEETTDDTVATGCCLPMTSYCRFKGHRTAEGYAWVYSARAAIVTSTIFMSTALIYLASEEADCLTDDGEIDYDCDNTVYGFKPSSLMTNIAVVSGVLAAFFMPLVGALVDYTPYRRHLGIGVAILIGCGQFAMIFTFSSTWFVMAVYLAIGGFLYQVQVVTSFAYLPDIARDVGERNMTKIASKFAVINYITQCLYLTLISVSAFLLGTGDVDTSHISQGICILWISIAMGIGWHRLPNAAQRHEIPEGSNILNVGFRQIGRTIVKVFKNYKKSLKWFFLGIAFAEAGASAFAIESVTFLMEVLDMESDEIGLVYLITMIATIPGAKLSEIVIKKTDPKISMILVLSVFSLTTTMGVFLLVDEDRKGRIYPVSTIWGVIIGWFYPTVTLFFSMILPEGQETEFSGFFVYCSQILVWFPPLLFTLMNEAGMQMRFGLFSLVLVFVIAILCFLQLPSWDEILEDVQRGQEKGSDEVDNEGNTGEGLIVPLLNDEHSVA